MIISDETLSAFLDAELSPSEMDTVRQRISEDETLANRLAELAQVDAQITQHYSAIDTRPLPDAISQLLDSAPNSPPISATTSATTSATIIVFPLWKKIQRSVQQHAAIAACTLLVLGFGLTQLLPSGNDSAKADWLAIAAALDTTASGTLHTLPDGKQLKPRLSFVNQKGNYCRQFLLRDNNSNTETIACHINNQWQLNNKIVAAHDMPPSAHHSDEYHTASNHTDLIDRVLDAMMKGDALDAQAETQAIANGWQQ